MEVARVTSKGQITIPRDIRLKMDLKMGDKILFFEENGKYFLKNSNSIILSDFSNALEKIQNNMKGEAEKAGFKSPNDVTQYIKSLRKAK